MNKMQFMITAYNRLGVLERILRVIRHRGGHIVAMDMQLADNNTIIMNVTIHSDRAAELMLTQLTKLIDVITVKTE